MLFGVKLQDEIYPPWKNYYIDYEGLKRMLKENVLVGGKESWTEADEKAFAAELDSELEKVYTFQVSKYKELDEQISELELQSEKYLEGEGEEGQDKLDSDEFEKTLEELLSEANELDHFARLNFTGFNKIVKKHDNLHKGYSVKALLNVRMKSLPLNNISEDTSPYLYRISVLYTFLREQVSGVSSSLSNSIKRLSTSGKLSTTPSAAVHGQEHVKVLKFWIHPDNLMETKTTILRHLPVMIYSNRDDGDGSDEHVSDPTISALYFDNRNFELYNAKLLKQKTETPSLRIRWTGKLRDNDDVTLEKKTFNYDTGDEEDVKLNLKPKYVNGFVFPDSEGSELGSSGSEDSEQKQPALTLDKYVKRLEKKELPEQTIEKYAGNFEKLQQFIVEHDLQPCLRSTYTRTAFQMPGDSRLKVTIDSDILFVREDAFDSDRPIRDPEQWHRTDIDSNVDNPYSLLRKGEYSKFPYSAMEIKISSSIANNPQSKTFRWIRDIVNGHLVKEVPNFSKFIQGVSSLFLDDDNLEILPFWLPELDTDIRKDPEQAYKDSKSKLLKRQQQAEVLKNLRKKTSDSPQHAPKTTTSHLDQIFEEGEDLDVDDSSDEESSIPTSSLSSGSRQMQKPQVHEVGGRKLSEVHAPPPVHYDSYEDERRHPMLLASSKNLERTTNFKEAFLPIFSKMSKLDGYESEDEEVNLPAGVVKPKQLIRQSGPVKVEAKVWLANERTFVRWLHVTSLLTALTFTIFSSIESTHFPELATATAYIYFALTLFSGAWAYAIYSRRSELIKLRSGKHLDGMFGPLVLGLVLLVSLGLEYYAGVRKYVGSKSLFATDQLTGAFVLEQPSEQVKQLHPLLQWCLKKMTGLVN